MLLLFLVVVVVVVVGVKEMLALILWKNKPLDK